MNEEEWREELHRRVRDFREGYPGGEVFFEQISKGKFFSFWKTTLQSSSTWATKAGDYIAVDELDDDHLRNIWNLMARSQDYMSLVWVSLSGDPQRAHKNLADDWFETTPIMNAILWEASARGITLSALPALDYSDVRDKKLSWEDLVE